MGKVILEFDSNSESQEIQAAMLGSKLASVLYKVDQSLRAKVKYEDAELIEVEEVRKLIRDELAEYDITFDNEVFRL
jgi:hypothetical protein